MSILVSSGLRKTRARISQIMNFEIKNKHDLLIKQLLLLVVVMVMPIMILGESHHVMVDKLQVIPI